MQKAARSETSAEGARFKRRHGNTCIPQINAGNAGFGKNRGGCPFFCAETKKKVKKKYIFLLGVLQD